MPALPQVPFGPASLTRLVIGGNPFRGNSHFSPAMDEAMRRYYTVARIKQALHAAERCGVNTVQARGDVLILQCIREYWDEGGAMHFIAQTASELRDLAGHVRDLAAFGALGVYVHGTFTDRHWHAGGLGPVRDLLGRIRDTGVQTGLGTHIPEVIDHAEAHGWDFDFYMACLYNLSRPQRRSALESGQAGPEHFDHDDKWAMFERIRATDKPCLAFKILGASRLAASPESLRQAFRDAYAHIKLQDACVVGMFPKETDQIAENAEIVRGLIAPP